MSGEEMAARIKPKLLALLEEHRARWDDPANWGREKEILRDVAGSFVRLLLGEFTQAAFNEAFAAPEVQQMLKDLVSRVPGARGAQMLRAEHECACGRGVLAYGDVKLPERCPKCGQAYRRIAPIG